MYFNMRISTVASLDGVGGLEALCFRKSVTDRTGRFIFSSHLVHCSAEFVFPLREPCTQAPIGRTKFEAKKVKCAVQSNFSLSAFRFGIIHLKG